MLTYNVTGLHPLRDKEQRRPILYEIIKSIVDRRDRKRKPDDGSDFAAQFPIEIEFVRDGQEPQIDRLLYRYRENHIYRQMEFESGLLNDEFRFQMEIDDSDGEFFNQISEQLLFYIIAIHEDLFKIDMTYNLGA